ncbi:MAG: hypothetical protein JSS81_03085 [Acidobacteria bacterium]|nr:hypothetical protein [Acidobacteriota bacterium]
MRNAACFLVLVIFGCLSILADDLRQKAEESPFDCAFYLATKDSLRLDKEALANALFEVGKYDDAARAIELDDDEYQNINWFVYHAWLLSKSGNDPIARKYVDKTMPLLKDADFEADKYNLSALASLLVKYGRDDEAMSLPAKSDNPGKTAIDISEKFLDADKPAKALEMLPQISEIGEVDYKAEVIELNARLKQTAKAEQLLAEFEPAALINEPVYHNRRFIIFPLVKAYLALGKIDRAVELWEQYGEKDDGFGWLKFIDSLLEFGRREKAAVYLGQIETDPAILQTEGGAIVERYLKLGKIEKAQNLAKTMSGENDSYRQQQALMIVADYFIDNKNQKSALEILDFAFQRARRVVFKHEDFLSIGASSGTRKVIYLQNICDRLIRLGKFDKAAAVIDSIGSDHWIAREFVLNQLLELTRRQIKTLPRRKIDANIARLQNLFTADDNEAYAISADLGIVELYAGLGEKTKAVGLLADVLEKARKSCCSENYFLLSAGRVFVENKLEPTADLRQALRAYLDD